MAQPELVSHSQATISSTAGSAPVPTHNPSNTGKKGHVGTATYSYSPSPRYPLE